MEMWGPNPTQYSLFTANLEGIYIANTVPDRNGVIGSWTEDYDSGKIQLMRRRIYC